MVTNVHLATMKVKRVIFHDVPSHLKEMVGGPTLSNAETPIDQLRRNMLKTKLTRVLDSKAAYPILFGPDAGSPVPKVVRAYTRKEQGEASFVEATQALANHLYQVQHGAVSPGLLCVIEFAADGKHGLILMKLEREAGAQIKMSGDKKRFEMEVLDDLVLTDGTRLFKTAAFLRTGAEDEDFLLTACDSQHRVTDSSEMARFWIKYLGCVLKEEPRVATSKFFNASLEFINTVVTDPVLRTELYDSLHAELRSNKRTLMPKAYIDEYMPQEVRKQYREFLIERHVAMTTFQKDVADIQGKLRRKTFLSEKGVVVSAPEQSENLVEVTEENIIVQDRLRKVGR